jgi:GH24 family phage-related lysozyme (muramidase)
MTIPVLTESRVEIHGDGATERVDLPFAFYDETNLEVIHTAVDGIPPKSYVAFVSLTYNIGIGAFCRSTARKRLDAGNLEGACDAATWYNRAGGRKIPGLVNRRAAEHRLCLEGAR